MIRNCGFAVEMIAVAIVIAFISVNVVARNRNEQSSPLEEQLNAKYKSAQIGRGISGSKVTGTGTVLVIKTAGIVGVTGVAGRTCAAKFENGSLHRPSEWCLGKLRMIQEFTRDLGVNENVYVTKLDVDQNKDTISFEIIECGSSYKSDVVFQFKKGELESADISKVTNVINQVLAVSDSSDQQQATGIAPQPISPPSAPAPSVPHAPAKPIEVGETLQEVKANAGDDLVLVTDLVTTKIYRYNGQRIKFENGVVTEIQ